ncbi:hypothetical protein KFU94_26880 [Chloroflexi bacterium TSY]|nr:hypothetical protein [Chloroflexi bacterium TSY]
MDLLSLTVELADELGVALTVGRVVNDHFAEAGRRYDQQDGHIQICRVTEENNNISMQIPGFIAPSKYGANPDYVRSGENAKGCLHH